MTIIDSYNYTVLNNMTLSCTKYYQNWSMSVEEIASQSSVILDMTEKTYFRGSRFPR